MPAWLQLAPGWLSSSSWSWHGDQEAGHGGPGRGALAPGVKGESDTVLTDFTNRGMEKFEYRRRASPASA